MYNILLSSKFEKSFDAIKDKGIAKQVWKKIIELEKRAPIGKKLKNCPFWSIHINRYRVIYTIEGQEIVVSDLLLRKHEYKEI